MTRPVTPKAAAGSPQHSHATSLRRTASNAGP